jgi:lipopolysaccharide export system permease protein
MKTLDRYIVRQFLINYAILLMVFTLLFVVVDLIVDIDEFVKAGRLRAGEGSGWLFATAWTIADYYGPTMVLLYVFFSGLVVVAAMGFAFSSLARSRELTAMVSSGISLHRVAAPVVVVACLFSGLTLLAQEFLIPSMAYKLTRSKSQLGKKSIRSFEVRYAVDSKGNLLSAAQFEAQLDQPMLTGVTILERDPLGRATRRISAEQAFWSDAYTGWELVGGYAIHPEAGASRGEPSTSLSPDMNQAQPVDFFATDLSPKVLFAHQAGLYPRLLSFADLRDLAANPAVDAGPLRRIMHGRFSLLVLNVLVLVIGLPFFLSREPTNMLRQGVTAAGVSLAAWALCMFVPEAAAVSMNPVASAWLPVVILLPISAVGLQMIRS